MGSVFAAAVASWTWEHRAWRWAAVVIVAATMWPSVRRPDIWAFITSERHAQAGTQSMGEYLASALPPEAVALGFIHTGAVAHYTHHNVVRFDLVPASRLGDAVDILRDGGNAPVFVLDELLDEPLFRERFKDTPYGALDWPPRAEFVSATRIRYWVASDRARHLAGERWATDVLR